MSKSILSHHTRSISNISAQFNKLYSSGRQEDFVLSDPLTGQVFHYSEMGVFKYILAIMFIGGLRVSDVLNIRAKDILPSAQIVIKQSKGSESKIIRVPELENYLNNCKKALRDPFFGISRFQVYRMFKKVGLGTTFGKTINESVTHYPRKVFAKVINQGTQDLELVQRSIGHRNKKSTGYYV